MNEINDPLITIYITNHNYGQYIEAAILSVLNQTLQDFELLIIDDGSTDNSKKIIKKYSDRENISTVFQNNSGLTVTNNIALRMARGKYIVRLDADDYFDENALQVLSGILERNTNIGLAFPDYYLVDAEANIIDMVRRHDFDNVTMLDQPAHGACTMIRTKCLRALGGYDEDFRCQDGYELWIRFIQHYKVKNVNLPLFYYRQHPVSLTKNEVRILETRSKILEKQRINSQVKLKSVAIIPVRGQITDLHSIALRKLENKLMIDWTIDTALNAKQIDDVIVTSPDRDILQHVENRYGTEVIAIHRDSKMAQINTHLEETIFHALDIYEKKNEVPDVVVQMFVESPFRLPRHIDNAIDIMCIFDSDTVIGVREETDIFFQHDGSTLKPMLPNDFLRLEADAVYRKVGNFQLVKVNYLKKHKKMSGGRMGHIVIENKYSLGVTSEWEWEQAKLMAHKFTS